MDRRDPATAHIREDLLCPVATGPPIHDDLVNRSLKALMLIEFLAQPHEIEAEHHRRMVDDPAITALVTPVAPNLRDRAQLLTLLVVEKGPELLPVDGLSADVTQVEWDRVL